MPGTIGYPCNVDQNTQRGEEMTTAVSCSPHALDIYMKEVGRYPNVTRLFLPRLCNQCGDPPCLHVCPTGATFIRPDGIVDIDDAGPQELALGQATQRAEHVELGVR